MQMSITCVDASSTTAIPSGSTRTPLVGPRTDDQYSVDRIIARAFKRRLSHYSAHQELPFRDCNIDTRADG